jgi:hypothetical protein
VRLPWSRKGRAGTLRSAGEADKEHLTEFLRTRRGVEAFLEPRTAVTETTLLLVAGDGEWTRRRVPGPDAAAAFARKNDLPLYEAAKVGYPRRMREWTAKQKQSRAAAGEGSAPGSAEGAS